MFRIGEIQELTIGKKVEFGVYLTEGEDAAEKVLLPSKQVPEGSKVGDKISVFIYRDSKDRLIATTNIPTLTLGKVACCKVKENGKIGAFLDWGLEKDLLLPYREQTAPVKAGDEIPVALYIDKSNRLCATMKLYKYLQGNDTYVKDDQVSGIVYEISDNFGAFVVVDGRYSALIPRKEMTKGIYVGQKVNCRVTAVKSDGKLDLSMREKAYIQMNIDADKLMKKLEAEGGSLDFNDKASPELIRERMDMSKNEFKRAVGNLLKVGRIEITEDGIRIKREKK
ncbi:MAG: S1 RNA-binding domain-containing protein [Lachnospiraceae bacterium]|nr:S1 RNA-binding domain-containing protein [Lachnospiraceae bacterium]